LEYISQRVMPYDQASVFSSYFGFLLLSVSSVSGANHFIGADDCRKHTAAAVIHQLRNNVSFVASKHVRLEGAERVQIKLVIN